MISIITANNVALDLGADTRITMVRQNPFWRDDIEFETEISLPFNIPNTPTNRKELGWIEEYQIGIDGAAIAAVVKVFGNDYFNGTLKVLDATDSDYTVAMVYQIDAKNLDLNIDELNYAAPSGSAAITSDFNAVVLADYPSTKYQLPEVGQFNPEFIKNFSFDKSVSYDFLNYYDGFSFSFEDFSVTVPMVYLQYVLDVIAQTLKISKVKGTFKAEYTGRKMLVYNNITAVASGNFLPIWEDLLGVQYQNIRIKILESNGATSPFNVPVGTVITIVFNLRVGGTGSSTHTVNHTVAAPDLVTAQISLMDALNTTILASSANIVLNDKLTTGATTGVFAQYYWNVSGTMFQSADITVTFPSTTLAYETIDFKKHLPNITIGDLFSKLKEWFCLSFNYDVRNNELDISPKKDLVNEEEDDYTTYLTGQLKCTVQAQQNFKLNWVPEDEDTLSDNLIDGLETKTYNNPKGAPITAIEVDAITLAQDSLNNGFGALTVSAVNQPTYFYSDNNKDFKLRLLLDEGYNSYSAGAFKLRQATSFDLTPKRITDSHWAPYVSLVNSSLKQFEGDFMLNYAQLINFNPKRKWRIQNNVFIWKELRTELTMLGIQPTHVIMKKI